MNNQLHKPYFIAILSTLMAFASISTDIYLPAMPQMAGELKGDVELTITGFLIGFALAQLMWGPISDAIGRRFPLFIGMLLFIIGSIGCALSKDIQQIVFWRVIQAFGACTGPLLGRAMISDLFDRAHAAQMFSTLLFFMAIAPIIGPLTGGQIIKYSNWQTIFWILAIIGGGMFLSLFWIPETLPPEKRIKLSLLSSFHNYFVLLCNRSFMAYTLCLAFYYVAAYSYMTGSPFVYIVYFGVDSQYYGWLFSINVLGVMIMSIITRRLVQKYPLDILLRLALSLASFAALALVLVVKFHFGGLVSIAMAIFLFISMNGAIATTSIAAALSAVPHMVGSASALIGALQFGSGIISSLLLTWYRDETPWPMACIIAVFTFASAIIILLHCHD